MHGRKKLVQAGALMFGLSLAAAPSADAALMLAATIGGVNYCATDGNVACGFGIQITDTDGVVNNEIALANQILGGLDVRGTLGVATYGPPQNILNLSSLQIINNTGATVNATVAIGATDYVPPVSFADLSGSGTWQNAGGSTINMTWYNDPENRQGAEDATDTPGIQLDSFADLASGATDSFNHTNNGIPVSDLNPFSMTLAFTLSLTDATPGTSGQLINRGQTMIKPVPEPATLVLLGGALSMGAWRLRRRRNG